MATRSGCTSGVPAVTKAAALRGPERPSEAQMKVLEAYAARPGTKLHAIATVQKVDLAFVEDTIDEWGGDPAGVKQTVEWYKNNPVEPVHHQQEEEPVTTNGMVVAEKPAATVKKTVPESVFPIPDHDVTEHPEFDDLTGADIVALIRDGDLSDVAATRQVANQVKAGLCTLAVAVRAEQAEALARVRREQLTAATKTRAARLAREAEALAVGNVEQLTREWLTRTTGKPVTEVTFEQTMGYLHSY